MKVNVNTAACDPNRLESLLSGTLSGAEQRDLELHLDACENCRRSLQQQAAEPEAWKEANELLQPPAFEVRSGDEGCDAGSVTHSCRKPLQIQNVLDALGPTDDPQMLGRLGGYEVSGIVGAGGMGVVLKAIDKSLDRTVAIKVLAPHLAASGAARKRFDREAKAAAAVLHPNVIAIHSVSNDEALPFLVMPYLRGASLQKRLDEEAPLALSEVLRIGAQIAAGLAAAHAQGLVHRDIKPANILLEDGVERVTITDFGLARAIDDATITRSGVIAGTPHYMSPEQARGEAVDQRSDLFSLGSLLYAICTGRPPFRAETTYGVIRRITDDEPTAIREINPDIPVWLCAIMARLMSKRASDRFESAAAVAELLENCLAHVQQPAAVPLPAQLRTDGNSKNARWRSWSMRNLAAIAASVVALFLAGVVIVLELNKGTLTIHSEADDVSLRIAQGEEVVQKLTVTRGDTSVRVAAGQYVVEIEGEADGVAVENGVVTLQRGGKEIVKIVQRSAAPVAPAAPPGSDPPAATLDPLPLRGGSAADEELRFSETKELVLAAGSMKFMLDFDSGQTMDMPARAGRPEEKLMDVLTDQMQPYHFPKELIGRGLLGKEVKASDWDASASEVRRALKVYRLGALKQMDVGPEKHPTYFFRTRDGGWGILQLLEIVDEPKGIRLRYKTVAPSEPAAAPQAGGGEARRLEGVVTDVQDQELVEVSLGAGDGLQVRDSLDVYRGKTHLGRLTVVRVAADASVARVESRTGEIRRGDRVSAERRAGLPPGGSAKIQLHFTSPQGATVIWKPSASKSSADHDAGLKLPARFSAAPDETIPFSLLEIPEREGLELSGSLEIAPLDKTAALFAAHNAITIEMTAEDFDQAASGNLVVKAIYVPNAEHQETPIAGVESLVTQRLDPGVDPVAEAERRGHVLAVLRLGNRVRQPAAELGPETADAAAPPMRHFLTTDRAATIAVSADGKRIAVANGNPTLILMADGTSRVKDNWRPSAEILDAQSGKTIVSLQLSTEEEEAAIATTPRVSHFEVTALDFAPDGSLLAVGTSIGQVKLFDAKTGELVRSLDVARSRVAATPESWKSLPQVMGSIRSLAFSPDGSLLAACGQSFADFADLFDGIERLGRKTTGPGRLKVWEVKTGDLQHDLAGHSHAFAVAFSADGEMLASAGSWSDNRDDGTGVIVWNPRTGEKLRTIAVEASGGAQAIAFSPTKKLLVIGSRNFDKENDTSSTTITVAYPMTGVVEWQRMIPGYAHPTAFSPDGKNIAVLGGGETVRFLDSATGKLRHEIKAADTPAAGQWNDLAVASEPKILVVGASDAEKGGSVGVWSLAGVPLGANEGPAGLGQAGKERAYDLAWGEAVGGLQAGIGFFGSDRQAYRRGEIVPIAVKLRNVSRQAIPITYSEARLRHARPDIRDADGQRLRVQMPPAVRYVYPTVEKTLEPGEEMLFDKIELRLSADEPVPAKKPGIDAKPGAYTISYTIPLIKPVRLTTGELHFEIQEAGDLGDVSGEESEKRETERRFAETKEMVLSMGSLKFMLDLDTNQTMDPPATAGRPEQKLMDVQATQMQPSEMPTGLTGHSLQGVKVQPGAWHASVADLSRVMESDAADPLEEMHYDPDEKATWFFQTRDGSQGILQLRGLVSEPKGILVRYKVVRPFPVDPAEQPE